MPRALKVWSRRVIPLAIAATMLSMLYQGIAATAALETGQRALDFRATLDDGSPFQLDGQVTVLTFWASWCAPCRQEAPILNRLAQRGVRVLGVSLDPDATPGVKSKAAGMGIEYRVAAERSDLVKQFRIQAVPSTFVIAADRRVVFARAGVVTEAELLRAVAEANP